MAACISARSPVEAGGSFLYAIMTAMLLSSTLRSHA